MAVQFLALQSWLASKESRSRPHHDAIRPHSQENATDHSKQSERDTKDSKRETAAIASGISNNRNPGNRKKGDASLSPNASECSHANAAHMRLPLTATQHIYSDPTFQMATDQFDLIA